MCRQQRHRLVTLCTRKFACESSDTHALREWTSSSSLSFHRSHSCAVPCFGRCIAFVCVACSPPKHWLLPTAKIFTIYFVSLCNNHIYVSTRASTRLPAWAWHVLRICYFGFYFIECREICRVLLFGYSCNKSGSSNSSSSTNAKWIVN